MTIATDLLLYKFVAYAEEEVRCRFPELDECDLESLIGGAAIMLAFFGIAKLTGDEDSGYVWAATGRLTSVRRLTDIKMAAHEDSSA